MSEKRYSVDGFVPRRLGGELGELHRAENLRKPQEESIERPLNISGKNPTRVLGQSYAAQRVGRSDIDESLREIDESVEPEKKLTRRQRRRARKMAKKQASPTRRIIKWSSIIISVLVVGVFGFLVYKFIAAGNNIFGGDLFGWLQSQSLKMDSNGRSNFLILGTSENDPGHNGADLTDSMMVVSIDQKNKNIYMFSIPRDLYVKYGMACAAGYEGKINAYFACSNGGDTKEAEQDRLSKTQQFVGNIFGMDIQYGVHVNGTVIKEAVDAVGGVDVDVEGSNGAPGVLDRNFDWRCNFKCYLVKYTNGVHHLDGEHAWFLSMARGDIEPTYGLANSNFDREKNQQKIIMALKQKMMTTGTLTNISAITQLMDSFGNNLRTNIQTNEIRTLMKVAGDVKSNDVHTLSFFGIDGDSLVKSGAYNGASVVMPSSGLYDYSAIQSYIKQNLSNDPIAKEAAQIAVLNATGQAGYAKTEADKLKKSGFNVTVVDNAPAGPYDDVEIYQIGNGNSATAGKLASRYNITVKKSRPPVSVDGDVKFIIILGAVANY